MIRYRCARCNSPCTAQDGEAGTKLNCPHCGQRLQVPVPPPPVNKTLLGKLDNEGNKTTLGRLEVPDAPSPPAVAWKGVPPPVRRGTVVEQPLLTAMPAELPDAPENQESHRAGGRRRRRSWDEDDYDDRPLRRRRWSPCPQCGCTDPPRQTTHFGGASIALLVVGIFFLPLIIVAFLVQEKWEVCPECGEKLRQTGTGF